MRLRCIVVCHAFDAWQEGAGGGRWCHTLAASCQRCCLLLTCLPAHFPASPPFLTFSFAAFIRSVILLAYNFIFHTVVFSCHRRQLPTFSQRVLPPSLSVSLLLQLNVAKCEVASLSGSRSGRSFRLASCRNFGNYAKAIIIIKRNVLKAGPSFSYHLPSPSPATPPLPAPCHFPSGCCCSWQPLAVLIKFCAPKISFYCGLPAASVKCLLHNLPSPPPCSYYPSVHHPQVFYALDSGRNFINLQNKNWMCASFEMQNQKRKSSVRREGERGKGRRLASQLNECQRALTMARPGSTIPLTRTHTERKRHRERGGQIWAAAVRLLTMSVATVYGVVYGSSYCLPACLPPATAAATATAAAGFVVVVFMAVTSCGQRALCDCIHGNEY